MSRLLAIAYCTLACASALYSYSLVQTVQDYEVLRSPLEPSRVTKNSGIPSYISGHESDLVRLYVEESVRYNPSHAHGNDEWNAGIPEGGGSFRMPGTNRALFSSMFHQLHCIGLFAKEMLVASEGWERDWHVQHCFNFIREMILCHPNLTLEPGNFMDMNYTTQRSGTEHVCRDWTKVWAEVDGNFKAFKAARTNSSRHG